MRTTHKLISAVTAGVMSLSIMAGSMPVALSSVNAASTSAIALVDDMGLGWNLGNTFDCWGFESYASNTETAWGNPTTTKAMIDKIAETGFKTVRIPITWDHDTNGNDIDDAYLARIKEVIDYCTANDMYVIINMHWDWVSNGSGWLNQGLAAEARYRAMWNEIATYFKSYDQHLIFESMNEVDWNSNGNDYTADEYNTLNTLNAAFVEVVRKTKGNNSDRLLLLAGANTNLDFTCSSSYVLPDDDMLAVSIHYYLPPTFCVAPQDSSWGYSKTWGTDAEKNTLAANFNKMKTTFVDKGVPVILGEYGVLTNGGKDEAAIKDFLKTVASTSLATSGISSVLWDSGNCGDMQYFDRKNLKWFNDDIGKIYADLAGGQGLTTLDWVETTFSAMEDTADRYEINIGDSDKFKFDVKLSDAQKAVMAGGGGGSVSYWDDANSKWLEGALSFTYTVLEDGSIELRQLEVVDGEATDKVLNYGYIEIPDGVTPGSVQVSFYYAGYDDAGTWKSLDKASIDKAYTIGLVEVQDTTAPSEEETTKPTEADTTAPTEEDTTEATDPVEEGTYFTLHGQFAGNDFWSDDVKVPVDGSGTYSLKWEAAGETKSGDLAMFIDSNVNIYQYAINEDSTGIADGTLNVTLDKVLVDGEEIELTGEPKLMTMDDGKSLRLTVQNPWGSAPVSAFDPAITVAESIEVVFTVQLGLDDTPGDILYGDVDDSGVVDIMDVIAINKSLLGGLSLSDTGRKAADVDRNDAIDTTDALNILKAVVKLTTLPVES